MKIKFAYLPAILLTGLLMGCKPSTPPVDGTPAKDTNVVSTATDPATTGTTQSPPPMEDYAYERKDAFVTQARADLAAFNALP
jgi:hypothetical protein